MWISKSGDDNNIRSLCVYINIESYFPHFSLLCVTHVCFCRCDKGRIGEGEKVKYGKLQRILWDSRGKDAYNTSKNRCTLLLHCR